MMQQQALSTAPVDPQSSVGMASLNPLQTGIGGLRPADLGQLSPVEVDDQTPEMRQSSLDHYYRSIALEKERAAADPTRGRHNPDYNKPYQPSPAQLEATRALEERRAELARHDQLRGDPVPVQSAPEGPLPTWRSPEIEPPPPPLPPMPVPATPPTATGPGMSVKGGAGTPAVPPTTPGMSTKGGARQVLPGEYPGMPTTPVDPRLEQMSEWWGQQTPQPPQMPIPPPLDYDEWDIASERRGNYAGGGLTRYRRY